MPLVRRTRATLRRAEFGFFGVLVYTRVHTPRRWGAPFRAGVLVLSDLVTRPLRTSCWMVGNANLVVQRDGRTVAALEPGARPTEHGRTRERAVQPAARWNGPNRRAVGLVQGPMNGTNCSPVRTIPPGRGL